MPAFSVEVTGRAATLCEGGLALDGEQKDKPVDEPQQPPEVALS